MIIWPSRTENYFSGFVAKIKLSPTRAATVAHISNEGQWRAKNLKIIKKKGGFVLDFKTHGRKKCCDSKFRSLSAFYLMKNLQGRYTFYSISLRSFLPSFYYCVLKLHSDRFLIKIFAFKTTYTLEVTQ